MGKIPHAMPATDEYNKDSFTAVLATLIAHQDALKDALNSRLDRQDEVLGRIEAQTIKTNGRVSLLEKWRDSTKTRIATVAALLGLIGGVLGWLVQIILDASSRS